MDEAHLVKTSKYLSKHLRHQPERIGLTLAPGGWVSVDDLLAACAKNQMSLSLTELEEIVARNSKQRFAFDETGTRIRANQGHTVYVDLQLSPAAPPDRLYHGTGHTAVETIRREGLRAMSRHHVHLSPDTETARRVGAAWPPGCFRRRRPRHARGGTRLFLLGQRRLACRRRAAGVLADC